MLKNARFSALPPSYFRFQEQKKMEQKLELFPATFRDTLFPEMLKIKKKYTGRFIKNSVKSTN